MYLKDLQAKLDRGNRAPAYVFTGGDQEEYGEAIKRLRSILVAPGYESFNYARYDGRENTAEEIVGSARTRAMGPGGRLIVVREPKGLSVKGLDELIRFLGSPVEENCMIVIAEGMDLKHRLMKHAKDTGILVDFRTPPWEGRNQYVKHYFRRLGLKVDAEVLRELETALSDDKGLINRELEKIVLSLGDRKQVTAEDVKGLLVDWSSAGIYDLADHIRKGDNARAIRIVDKLLEEGEEPIKLVGFLARQFRMLMAAKLASSGDLSGFKDLKGLPAAVINRIMAASNGFEREELHSALLALRSVDRRLKSTMISPAFLMETFLENVLGSDRNGDCLRRG